MVLEIYSVSQFLYRYLYLRRSLRLAGLAVNSVNLTPGVQAPNAVAITRSQNSHSLNDHNSSPDNLES